MRQRSWGRRRGRSRLTATAVTVVGLVCIVLAVLAPPVGANYGRISASAGCDGVVRWSATASTEGTDDQRTNTSVEVAYRPLTDEAVDSGSSGDWMVAEVGSFSASNGFTFTGEIELPQGATGARLRVAPVEPWGAAGDGDPPGDPRFATTQIASQCEDSPLTATLSADCDAGGAAVNVVNSGDTTQTATVSLDTAEVRELSIPAGAEASLVVPLLDHRPSLLRVAADGFVLAETDLTTDCAAPVPAAVVVERCASHRAVVLASTPLASPAALEVLVDSTSVHTEQVTRDRPAQLTIELPPGRAEAVEVEVRLDDRIVAAAAIGACDSPVAGAVTCGVDGHPDCDAATPAVVEPPVEAPPTPPPPLELIDGEPVLPRTGPWERAVALFLGGLLLSLGGTALVVGRRPQPERRLASALAPYRQRWWEDG